MVFGNLGDVHTDVYVTYTVAPPGGFEVHALSAAIYAAENDMGVRFLPPLAAAPKLHFSERQVAESLPYAIKLVSK